MAVYTNTKGTTSKDFTIGKQGLTMYPSGTDPVGSGTVKASDIWFDVQEKSLRFRSDENDNWVLPVLDDLRVSGNAIFSGAKSPGVTQNIELSASGSGTIVVDNNDNTPVITTQTEKHLLIRPGDTTTGASGNLLLEPGQVLGVGQQGSVIIASLAWPNADGSSGQLLSTNGNGQLSWTNAGGISTIIEEGDSSVVVADTGVGTVTVTVDGNISGTFTDGLATLPSVAITDITDTEVLFAGPGGAVSSDSSLTYTDETLQVGNALLVGNASGDTTISTSKVDGNIILEPDGAGIVEIQGTGSAELSVEAGQDFALKGDDVVLTSVDGNTVFAEFRTTGIILASLAWPTSDGTDGQTLVTDGLGTLSWADASSGSPTSIEEGDSSVVVADSGVGTVTVTVDGNVSGTFTDGLATLPSVAISDVTDTEVLFAGPSGAVSSDSLLTYTDETLQVGNALIVGNDASDTTISTSKVDGNIILEPDGAGIVEIQGTGSAELSVEAGQEFALKGDDVILSSVDGNTVFAEFRTTGIILASLAWPTSDGTDGQTLVTDGNGTLSWADAGSGSPTSIGEGDSSVVVADTGVGTVTVTVDGNISGTFTDGLATLPSVAISDVTDIEVLFAGPGGAVSSDSSLTYTDETLQVGNALLVGNASGDTTLSTSKVDGNIILDPEGAGIVEIQGTGSAELSAQAGQDFALKGDNVIMSSVDGVSVYAEFRPGSFIIPGTGQAEVGSEAGQELMLRGDDVVLTSVDGNTVFAEFRTTGIILASLAWPTSDGTDGQALVTDGNGTLSWAEAGGGGIEEAPTDGKVYGRSNSSWTELETGGASNAITEGDSSVVVSDSGVGTVTITVDGNVSGTFTDGLATLPSVAITDITDTEVLFAGPGGAVSSDSLLTYSNETLQVGNASIIGDAAGDTTFSTNKADGSIILNPNGNGSVIIAAIGDNAELSAEPGQSLVLTGDDVIVTSDNASFTTSDGNTTIAEFTDSGIILSSLFWPTSDGSPGQRLITNGIGQLSWESLYSESVNETEVLFAGPSGDINSASTLTYANEILQVGNASVVGDAAGDTSLATSKVNGNIQLIPDGTGSVVMWGLGDAELSADPGQAMFLRGDDVVLTSVDSSTVYASFTDSGVTIASLAWPTSDGTDGQALVTDGNGTLSWADAGGGQSDRIQDADNDTYVSVSEVDDSVVIQAGPDDGNILLKPNASVNDTAAVVIDNGSGDDAIISSTASIDIIATNDISIQGLTYPSVDGTDGQALVTDGNGTLSWADASGGIEEAPTDGKVYGRSDSTWEEIETGGASNAITEGDSSVVVSDTGTGSVTFTLDGNISGTFTDGLATLPSVAIDDITDTEVLFAGPSGAVSSDSTLTYTNETLQVGNASVIGNASGDTTISTSKVDGNIVLSPDGEGIVEIPGLGNAELSAEAGQSLILRGDDVSLTSVSGDIVYAEFSTDNLVIPGLGNAELSAEPGQSLILRGDDVVLTSVDGATVYAEFRAGTGSDNYLEISPAEAGNSPTITSSGSDADVGVVFDLKGNGTVSVQNSAVYDTVATSSSFVTKGYTDLLYAQGQLREITLNELVDVSVDDADLGYVLYFDGILWQSKPAGLDAVENDPNPKFGGDLDVGGFQITDSSGTGVVINGIKYPDEVGEEGQVLTTNGDNEATFQDIPVPSNRYILVENIVDDTMLEVGKSYIIIDNLNVILPDYSTLTVGDNIRIAKKADTLPTVYASNGQYIIDRKNGQLKDQIQYSNMTEMLVIFDGTTWSALS